jgi:hypothetical protein
MIGAMCKTRLSSARWQEILHQQQASGLSVAAFCRQARVPQASFFACRRKLRGAVTFAEVKVPLETAGDTGAIELRLPGRRCLVVRPGFDRQTLLDLLATLEAGG